MREIDKAVSHTAAHLAYMAATAAQKRAPGRDGLAVADKLALKRSRPASSSRAWCRAWARVSRTNELWSRIRCPPKQAVDAVQC